MENFAFLGDCGDNGRTVVRNNETYYLGCFTGTYEETINAIKEKYTNPYDYIEDIEKIKTMSYKESDGNIDTVLRVASITGRLDVIKDLIDDSCDLDIIFGTSCEYGHLDIVKYIKEKFPHEGFVNGFTDACDNGHLDVVKYLVENGANVNQHGDFGFRWASFNNHLDVCKYLISKGADINSHSGSPIRWAARYGKTDMFKFLIDNGAEIGFMNYAVVKLLTEKNNTELLTYILDNVKIHYTCLIQHIIWSIEHNAETDDILKKIISKNTNK